MYKPLSTFIGLRYVRAKRRNHFISFISLISMLGIALGVTALITVISVMNGFHTELKARILGASAHAKIEAYSGSMEDWPGVTQQAVQHPEVLAAAPYVEQGVWLQGNESAGALLRGVEPTREPEVTELQEKMLAGQLSDLQPGGYGIALGIELAAQLRVTLGDKVTVIAPELRATPAGAVPLMKRFVVTGVFEFGENINDSSIAVVNIQDAAKLLRMGNSVTGVRLKLQDLDRAWKSAREIADQLDGAYRVRSWEQSRATLFQAVQMEKVVMWVILSLIVAVAAFNIVSTLIMVVTDKQADIAILKTMGAQTGTVMRTFMVQGMFIGVIGTALGIIGGLLLASNISRVVPFVEKVFKVELWPADIYYISELPSEVHSSDVIAFALMALGMAFLSTLYPAWRASRVQPAEALRYE